MMNNKAISLGVPAAVAVILMLATCIVQGRWSERWGEFPELQIFAEQLKEVPLEIGEWQGTDAAKSDDEVLKAAGAVGELVRVYQNGAGEQVRVSIICARIKDIFNHTPERCYPAAGFDMLNEPQQEVFEVTVKDASGKSEKRATQFLTTTFQKSDPTGTHVERGYWTWTPDGKDYIANKDAQGELSGERALLKVYVFGNEAGGKDGRSSHDYCQEFIREFVPRLETAMRPGVEKAQRMREGAEVAAAAQPVAAPPAAAQPAAKPAEPKAAEAKPAA